MRELLLGMRLIDGNRLLNAAVVLFGRPEALPIRYPQCLLRLARFQGVKANEFLDSRQEIGNIFDLLAHADRFLRDHVPVAGRIVPGQLERIDEPLYPPVALREALINAFAHRDYALGGGSVSIAIFDDRLEITSVGPLHFGLKVEDLLKPHPSRPWNPTIADVLYRRGLIEKWGGGTLRMAEASERAGRPAPEFFADHQRVTVTFRAARYVAPSTISHDLSPLQQMILQVLSVKGPSTLTQLLDELGEHARRRTLQDNLQMLRSFGLVELHGDGPRSFRWRLLPLNNSAAEI
jgi:ATP-dependent DNA helicase RecG